MRPTLLPVKDPLEIVTISFMFAEHLPPGVTVVSAVVQASVFTGVDPSPSAILAQAPGLESAPVVLQRVTRGVDGVTYLLTAAATTSTGDVIVLKAVLPVGS